MLARSSCVGIVLAAALAAPSSAWACGGFWCSQTAPVEQTREEILFAANDDGTTTCVVRIQYEGPSEKFAWVLPVQGVPKVGVSASLAFQRLDQATSPQFVLEQHVEGQCDPLEYPSYAGAEDAAAAADAGVAPSVSVLAEGSVGPYDYVVIRPNASLADPAGVAIDWFKKEGFDVTGITGSVLGPYLADGQNLIAFRLTKGQPSGAIRPVILTYTGDLPSIPIRPTAVAARDDMGVLVYVASKAQAVPKNYRSLVINESLVNWFNPGANYDAVVTAAGDQAGGQGFVTELAEPASAVAGKVFTDPDAQGLADLRSQTFESPIDLLFAANNYYRSWDGWKEAIVAALTLPPGVTLDEFNSNPNAYEKAPGFAFDTKLFLDQLESKVVAPVRDTQDILDSRPYLTRLYTTMSPGEMTEDPVFTFNADLAPVSNIHTAQLYLQCRPGIFEYQAPFRIELPQGGTLRGTGQEWPLQAKGPLPANQKIVQLSESGAGEVVKDNTGLILASLVQKGGTVTPPPMAMDPAMGVPIGGTRPPTGAATTSDKSSDGCSVGASKPVSSGFRGSVFALLGAALLLVRRSWRATRARGRAQHSVRTSLQSP